MMPLVIIKVRRVGDFLLSTIILNHTAINSIVAIAHAHEKLVVIVLEEPRPPLDNPVRLAEQFHGEVCIRKRHGRGRVTEKIKKIITIALIIVV